MPVSAALQFDYELENLLYDRTHELVRKVWPAKGAAPKVTKQKILRAIKKLQTLAESAVLRQRQSKNILDGADYKKS